MNQDTQDNLPNAAATTERDAWTVAERDLAADATHDHRQPHRRDPGAGPAEPRKKTIPQRIEAFISRLSSRNNFWHRVISMIYLPYAFRSGIRMINRDSGDSGPFEAMLPFRPFNKNWYNAMAGASLLGASEVAGGMAIFRKVGGDYRVVCKELQYRFLRPCIGPAVYRVEPQEDLDALMTAGGPFNIKVKINILQGLAKPGEREKRVGRCFATFHVSPKELARRPAKAT